MRTLDDHGDAVNAVIECAGRLASGSDDGTIKLWNTDTWQCEVTLGFVVAVAVAFLIFFSC